MAGKKGKQEIADLGFGNLLSKKKKKKSVVKPRRNGKFYSSQPEETFFRKLNYVRNLHNIVFETKG